MAIYLNGIKVAGKGINGLSPYEIAVSGGYTGTEAEFNAQLVNIGEATKGFDELKEQVTNVKVEVTTTVNQALSDIGEAKTDINTTVDSALSNVDTTVNQALSDIDAAVEDALNSIPDSENIATKAYVNEALSSVVSDIWYYGNSAPSNTKLLWIDSDSTTGGLKYYDGSNWVHVPVAWA